MKCQCRSPAWDTSRCVLYRDRLRRLRRRLIAIFVIPVFFFFPRSILFAKNTMTRRNHPAVLNLPRSLPRKEESAPLLKVILGFRKEKSGTPVSPVQVVRKMSDDWRDSDCCLNANARNGEKPKKRRLRLLALKPRGRNA